MEKLSKECFAYPQANMYPVHTRDAFIGSVRQYDLSRDSYSDTVRKKIQAAFEKAAAVHELPLAKRANTVISKKAVDVECGKATFRMGVPENTKQVLELALNIAATHENQGYSTKQLRKVAKTAIGLSKQVIDSSQYNQGLIKLPIMRNLYKLAGFGIGQQQEVVDQILKRANMLVCSPEDRHSLVQTSINIKNMSQQDFCKEATLNTICDTLQAIDKRFDLCKHYGKQLMQPKQACYKETLYDFQEKQQDLLKIASTDTILSKKALLQRKQKICSYFDQYFGEKVQQDDKMLEKVANLDKIYVKNFIQSIIDEQ